MAHNAPVARESNEEIVRRAFDAVDGRDRATVFRLLAAGVEWKMVGLWPDQPLVRRGREDIWEYVRFLNDQLPGFTRELIATEAIGDQVVCRFRVRAEGDGGAEGVDAEFSSLVRLRDGRITHIENYEDHAEALTDAELRA